MKCSNPQTRETGRVALIQTRSEEVITGQKTEPKMKFPGDRDKVRELGPAGMQNL